MTIERIESILKDIGLSDADYEIIKCSEERAKYWPFGVFPEYPDNFEFFEFVRLEKGYFKYIAPLQFIHLEADSECDIMVHDYMNRFYYLELDSDSIEQADAESSLVSGRALHQYTANLTRDQYPDAIKDILRLKMNEIPGDF